MTSAVKSKGKQRKLDGLTLFLVFLLVLFLAGGGGAAWYVYSAFDKAFAGSVQPKSPLNGHAVTEHAAAPQKIPANVEGEAQARAEWGQLGDYFGGTLNPLFSFISVLALLITLIVQSKELKISSEELRTSSKALKGQNKAIERQSFEQTFFSWLNSYHELLQSISQHNQRTGVELIGRQALFFWWSPGDSVQVLYEQARKCFETDQQYNEWHSSAPTSHDRIKTAIQLTQDHLSTRLIKKWDKTYLAHEYQLDSLFRNLYLLILWIDSQRENHLTLAQKWLYVAIIRGHLSWIEQVYLFYNGLTDRGCNFRKLADKYALFDNLTVENDLTLEHLLNNQPPDVAYKASAFNSRLARETLGLPESAEETLAAANNEIN